MFGVDFSELMVILVVALIVIGPERLPKVARTLGMLWARAQRYINGVKADIARDMAAEEVKQLRIKLQEEADKAQRAIQDTANTLDLQTRELHNAVIDARPQAAPPASPATAKELPAAEQKQSPVD